MKLLLLLLMMPLQLMLLKLLKLLLLKLSLLRPLLKQLLGLVLWVILTCYFLTRGRKLVLPSHRLMEEGAAEHDS
jgi:hypothetical protein